MSERANERASAAKRAVKNKQMSERCERTEERMAQFSTRRFHSYSTHRAMVGKRSGVYESYRHITSESCNNDRMTH